MKYFLHYAVFVILRINLKSMAQETLRIGVSGLLHFFLPILEELNPKVFHLPLGPDANPAQYFVKGLGVLHFKSLGAIATALVAP